MDGNHPKNIDPRPKRRKDRDNPYGIFTIGINTTCPHFYLSFRDSSGALLAVSDDKEKRTYSIEEIQQILDISRSTAYLLIKRKLFKSVKVGKQIRISKKSFAFPH